MIFISSWEAENKVGITYCYRAHSHLKNVITGNIFYLGIYQTNWNVLCQVIDNKIKIKELPVLLIESHPSHSQDQASLFLRENSYETGQ